MKLNTKILKGLKQANTQDKWVRSTEELTATLEDMGFESSASDVAIDTFTYNFANSAEKLKLTIQIVDADEAITAELQRANGDEIFNVSWDIDTAVDIIKHNNIKKYVKAFGDAFGDVLEAFAVDE